MSLANVHAVVVGCEHFQLAGWDLDGPAFDALRICRWLLECGVPPGQVHLLATPLESNRAAFDQTRGQLDGIIHHGDAHSSKVEEVFKRSVVSKVKASGAQKEDGLLIVFWSGHGALQRAGAARERVVFCTNLDPSDYPVIALSKVADWLAGQLSGFRFAFLVDACATESSKMRADDVLSVVGFARGSVKSAPSRLFAYAAYDGQVARNLGESQTGLFASRLLEELQGFRPRSVDEFLGIEQVLRAAKEKVKGQDVVWDAESWDGTASCESLLPPTSRRPPIAEDAKHLCDRTQQWREFKKLARWHFENRPKRPLLVFAHGDKDQYPNGFLRSLALRVAAEKTEWRACESVKHDTLFITLPGPKASTEEKEELKLDLARALRNALQLAENTPVQEIAAAIRRNQKANLLLISLSSQDLRHDPAARLQPLYDFWRDFPDIDGKASLTVIVYVGYRPSSGLARRLRSMIGLDPELSVRSYVAGGCAASDDALLSIRSLSELSSVTRSDLDTWNSWLQANYANSATPKQMDLDAIVQHDAALPMESVIEKLHALIGSLNQSNSFA